MQINYHIEKAYGTDRKYITDDEKAQAVQQLTGNKTINKQDINALEKLGHEVNHVPQR